MSHGGESLALHPLREAILTVQNEALSDALSEALSQPGHIWCIDSFGAGLDLELSLKSMEVVGVPSTALRDNLALHGPAEAIAPGDLILVNQAPDCDTERLTKLADATNATLVTLGSSDALWPLPDLGLFSPLIQLVAGWRLLGELALRVGHDPDHPQRITKIADQAF
jgi:fructoselysine-6-P-deglycase FrlB-like protein